MWWEIGNNLSVSVSCVTLIYRIKTKLTDHAHLRRTPSWSRCPDLTFLSSDGIGNYQEYKDMMNKWTKKYNSGFFFSLPLTMTSFSTHCSIVIMITFNAISYVVVITILSWSSSLICFNLISSCCYNFISSNKLSWCYSIVVPKDYTSAITTKYIVYFWQGVYAF